MTNIPAEFRQRLVDHNRSCWLGALLSSLGTAFGWGFFAALYYGGVLLFEVVRTGEPNLQNPPVWCLPGGAGLFLALFLWGLVDRWKRRYRPTSDRMIIGWHLFGEVLLFPPRSTFAVVEHLMAQMHLSQRDLEGAWRLLLEIFALERAEPTRLAQDFPDIRKLQHWLLALQLTDWIDLHRGDHDWFYKVTSNNERLLRDWTRPPELPKEDRPEQAGES